MAIYDAILDVLVRLYVSTINAKSILGRLVQEAGVTPSTLSARELPTLIPRLEREVGLFLEPNQRSRLHADLQGIAGYRSNVRAHSIAVRIEADIGVARIQARDLCEEMAARNLAVHRVVTIVSELARNMVSYAGGGTLDLIPVMSPTPKIEIKAVDRGPGIPHLKDVLEGTWRSKTGLGQGLRGTKRLADRFDITTSSDGTRVEVEVKL
jgi:serine/threonine-protein kinase RsbT